MTPIQLLQGGVQAIRRSSEEREMQSLFGYVLSADETTANIQKSYLWYLLERDSESKGIDYKLISTSLGLDEYQVRTAIHKLILLNGTA